MTYIIKNSNNCLLIISEIGLELEVDNIEEEYKKIFSKKIENKESILFNNNGDILNNLNEIHSENKEKEKFFLFNKKCDKELILKILDEYIKKLIYNYDSQLILDKQNLPDIYSNEKLLLDNSSKLKYIEANDIKMTFEKMLEYFENYKNIYTSFKVNSHICEEIKKNYKNINLSINILIDNINKISKICEQKKSETNNENKKLNEIKELNIKSLQEGIENLKSQELHPLLQTNDKKFLIDIYFDEKNLETKKEEIMKNEEVILKITKEKSALYINETKKFINEKEKAINEIQNEMNNISQEYDNDLNLLEQEPNKIYENLMRDFMYFNHSLLIIFDFLNNDNNNANANGNNTNISSNQDIKAFDESCEQINSLKNKYNDFSSLNQLQTKLEPINQINLKMRKSFENLAIKVNKIFKNLFDIYENINRLSENFSKIKQQTLNLEDCFNQLQNPSKFPMAYEQALEEIKRRIIFNHKIIKIFEIINNLVENETELRKNFKKKYGFYIPDIPNNFFSCLKNYDPKVKLEINTNEELNKFPKLITEEEISILLENINSDKNLLNISSEYNLNNDLKKIKELNDEINKRDEKIKNLESDLEKCLNINDNLFKNFVLFLKQKDEEIKRTSEEKNNMILFFNNKKLNNVQTCPLCKEAAFNNEPNSNFQLINNKLDELNNSKIQLEQRYKNLVINTIEIKKIFFNHMNNKIAEYNLNNINNTKNNSPGQYINTSLEASGNILYYNELKTNNKNYHYQNYNDIQVITKLLNEEKNKSERLNTEKNILISKYNNLITEIKKLQNKNEQYIKQINSLNEKIISIQKEKENLKDELVKKEKEKNKNENTIIELRQFIKQISEEKNSNESKQIKEMQKIKNKSIIFKDIKEGDKCMFVPYSEKIYVCINLSVDLNAINNDFFRCDIILDFSCFDEDKKKLIIENNLILIASISELKEVIIKEGEVNPFEVKEITEEENEEDDFTEVSTSINNYLKATNSYHLAKISCIDYIIGFPEDKLCFMNYNNNSNYINNINKK